MLIENAALLVIDAQYDFCNPKGALFVPGADSDVDRIANMVLTNSDSIAQIFVTLDTHHVKDIAHSLFWEDPTGSILAPYTTISAASVKNNTWIPRFDRDYVIQYLETLESEGAFQHIIWPEHCLIGTCGASLDDKLARALVIWTHKTGKEYTTVSKGLNPLTEFYGVFRAQVPVKEDVTTQLNTTLLQQLAAFEQILVAGEARSHCVATSIQQIIKYAPELVHNLIILTDCMSDVPNFGYLADGIMEEAQRMGAKLMKSSDLRY